MTTPFDIVSTYTPDYAGQAGTFLPSWLRNSGATDVRLIALPAGGSWGHVMTVRTRALADAVLEAAGQRRRVAALDLDVFVLRPLAPAFDGIHPLAIARWPQVNAGVQFFDTTIDFPWLRWFAFLAQCFGEMIDKPQGTGNLEQDIWARAYRHHEAQVNKLAEEEWNLTVPTSQWEPALRKYRDTLRIAHVKGRGDPKRQGSRIAAVQKLFRGKT